MDKWEYIKRISEESDHYGDKLLDLMDKCGACNLREVSEDAAKTYYERLKNDTLLPSVMHTTAADNVDNSAGRRKK